MYTDECEVMLVYHDSVIELDLHLIIAVKKETDAEEAERTQTR